MPSAATADTAAVVSSQSIKACDLVTTGEMSAILGAPVHAAPNDSSNGKTECIYTPDEGVSPYLEFSVVTIAPSPLPHSRC